jgi:hypothetical protein
MESPASLQRHLIVLKKHWAAQHPNWTVLEPGGTFFSAHGHLNDIRSAGQSHTMQKILEAPVWPERI